MSDVERLEAELALAKLSEKLEAAREAMHADSSPKNVSAFKKLSVQVTDARRDWRVNHRDKAPKPPGAGTANPETVRGKAKANL
jgi:hypothetical protein